MKSFIRAADTWQVNFVQFLILFSFLFCHLQLAQADGYPGLPTRSQNPLLQAYLIPTVPIFGDEHWQFAHNLYITNTYQSDSSSQEDLLIDVENSRYDLQAGYSRDQWFIGFTLSLISNQQGFLDNVIVDWHDFFGLPQGGRDMAASNQIHLSYQSQHGGHFDITEASSGIGDLQLHAGYQLDEHQFIWATLEAPFPNQSELFTNSGFDLAFGYAFFQNNTRTFRQYAAIGSVLPANNGLFRNRINDYYLFAHYGVITPIMEQLALFLQLDLHGPIVRDNQLEALSSSLQGQFGLRFNRLIPNYHLDLFFSEDIRPGYAPDITFSLRISPFKFH